MWSGALEPTHGLGPTSNLERTSVVLEPTSAVLESTNAVLEPTGVVLEPTGAVLEPTSAVLDPTSAVLDPTWPKAFEAWKAGGLPSLWYVAPGRGMSHPAVVSHYVGLRGRRQPRGPGRSPSHP